MLSVKILKVYAEGKTTLSVRRLFADMVFSFGLNFQNVIVVKMQQT